MIQEIEIKFLVQSQKDLDALEKRASEMFAGKKVKEVLQTNFFFDTTDFAARKKGIGIRLRKQDDHYFMTLKGPGLGKKEPNGQKLTSRLEFEAEVTQVEAKKLLEGKQSAIAVVEALVIGEERMRKTRDHLVALAKLACAQEKLAFIGSFNNRRRILPIEIARHPMKLEFDQTLFLGNVIHFEVELEIPSMDLFEPAEAFLVHLFHECGQTPGYQKSKSERFYSFLGKKKGV
jgi:uncharacterized protein YjbK